MGMGTIPGMDMNPGTGKRVWGGCWWVNLVFYFGPKPFYLKVRFWNWTKPNNNKHPGRNENQTHGKFADRTGLLSDHYILSYDIKV